LFIVIGLELLFESDDDPDFDDIEKFMINIPLKEAKYPALYKAREHKGQSIIRAGILGTSGWERSSSATNPHMNNLYNCFLTFHHIGCKAPVQGI
jgi:hypothetical protein